MNTVKIIGAGPAGLVAAIVLRRHGIPVTVFEKSPEVGHRLSGDFQGLENWSWGGQAAGTLHTGGNDNGYALGDSYSLTTWVVRRWSARISTSLRINGQLWGNIEGADTSLTVPPAVNPTADPELRAGRRWDMLFGTNVYIPGSGMRGHRLSFEGGLPVYQNLDGPQLETDWIMTLGYRYAL